MATRTLVKPEEKVGNWSTIFPTETKSSVQSALFVKKLLAVSVSNIAYLRVLFPEAAFGEKSLEGVNLKILKDDKSCLGAVKLIRWVNGCFDALDKKYLRAMMLGLYLDPDNPDTVIESYTFKFSYADEGGMDIYRNNERVYGSTLSEMEVRKSTIKLLRNLILLTQNLGTVPDDARLTMKLLYYDDVTPDDYEPPGFQSGEDDKFEVDGKAMTIKVGDINTVHHALKVRMTTNKDQFKLKDGGMTASQTESQPVIDKSTTNQKTTPGSGKQISHVERLKDCKLADVPLESPAKPVENAVDVTGSQISQRTDVSQEFLLRCPCECNMDDGLMIICAECRYWQHGVCFRILEENEAPENHLCDICAKSIIVYKEKQEDATDPSLVELTSVQAQATCLWRRALHACMDMTKVLAPGLATRLGTEVPVAQGLINRLNKEGFLKPAGKSKKLGRTVDTEKIKAEGIPKYLRLNSVLQEAQSQDDETQRDEEESQCSQRSMQACSEQLDHITEKTEELAINSKKTGKLSRKKKNRKNKQEQDKAKENVPSKEPVKARGTKRLYSDRDEFMELERCNPQDVYVDEPKKKRKSSIPRDQHAC